MRKLGYSLNLQHLRVVKSEIVPTLFTPHQFQLIEKKYTQKLMTASEKNEFSRTVSRKMKAISALLNLSAKHVFIYGKKQIIPERLELALRYLKQLSRKFKGRHLLISGSFMYRKKYNDIDIFVISSYEKEDIFEDKFHITFLTQEAYHSLFFASLAKLCVSNRKIEEYSIHEKVTVDTFISLYQELCNDLDRNFKGIKKTIREFLLQSAFITHSTLPNSLELRNKTEIIIKKKNQRKIIQRIFEESIILGVQPKRSIPVMKEMITSYKNILKEYPQHKEYYQLMIQSFREVIALAS